MRRSALLVTALLIIAPLAQQASAGDVAAAVAMKTKAAVHPGLEWMFVPNMWRSTEDCLREARFANIALVAVKAKGRIDPGVCFDRDSGASGGDSR